MKRFILLFVCLLAAVLSVRALSYTDENSFTWYYIVNDDGETATLTNSTSTTTEYPTYAWTSATSLSLPSEVSDGTTTYKVTAIGDYFMRVGSTSNCADDLASVTIPETVTYIGIDAFYYCTSLTSLEIPSSVTSIGNWAFRYSGLTSITIPSSVESIGNGLFVGCESLVTATFAEGSPITTLPQYTFGACTALTEVTLPSGLETIDQYAFYYLLGGGCTSLTSISLPSTVKTIGTYAFRGCTALTTIELPASLESLGDGAFTGCSSLATFSVAEGNTTYSVSEDGVYLYTNGTELVCIAPASLTSTTLEIAADVTAIAASAFRSNTTITTLTFAEGSKCTSIGSYAFAQCTKLESVTLPESLTSIGSYAFYYCSSLTSISIPAAVETIGEGAIDYCSTLATLTFAEESAITELPAYFAYYCKKLATIENFPSSITSIGEYAFYYCSALTAIDFLPASLTSIGEYAFYRCTGATSVTIPAGVESVGRYCFYYCTSLTEVTFTETSSLTEFSAHMFQNCTSLTGIEVPAGVKVIGERAFASCSKLASVTFEDGSKLKSIESYAFYALSALTEISLPSTLEYISPIAFYNTSAYNNGTTSTSGVGLEKISIAEGGVYSTDDDGKVVFKTENGVVTLALVAPAGDFADYTIPESVTILGDSCFYNNRKLNKLTIPATVRQLGTHSFYYCYYLTDVTLGESSAITAIPPYCFQYCQFSSIELPSGLTTIDDYAFSYCSALTSVTIPASVETIGDYSFASLNSSTSSLTTVTFEDESKCTSIGSYAFYYSKSLTSINLPDGLEEIGSYAFYYCSALTEIAIPEGVSEIPTRCFQCATALTTITLPSTLTLLGMYCLYNCTALNKIVCYAEAVPKMYVEHGTYGSGTSVSYVDIFNSGSSSAPDLESISIYVPPFSLSTYQGATGSEYAEYDESSINDGLTYSWDGKAWDLFGDDQFYPFVDQTVSGEAGMGTIALPFEATIPDGLTAYTVGSLNDDGTEVALTAVSSGETLAAGTPCIVVISSDEAATASEDDEETTTTSDLACEWLGTTNALGTDDSETTYTVESVVNDGNAYGVFQKSTLTTAGISSDDDDTSTASEDEYTYYILQQHSGDETPKFYKVGSTNVTVGAYRAYLALSSSESTDAESIAFTFVESDEVTGIGSVSVEQTADSGLYYDLQGRQVRTPQKGGIYIKDGKKVII